jgi:hypothetical protein
MKDFERFNEAKKEKKEKKWYGIGGLQAQEEARKKANPYHYNYDDDDDIGHYDYDPGDFDADPDFDPEEFENEFSGGGYGGGGYGGYYGYQKPYDPKVGDEITYLGNTGKRRNQTGKVHKIRDDGKVVIRFDDDRKLLAASKNRIKLTNPPVEEEPPAPVEEPLPAGKNWWEKFKKDEAKD